MAIVQRERYITTLAAKEREMDANGIGYILLDVDDTVTSTKGVDHPAYKKGRQWLAHLIERANAGEIPPIGFCTGREASYVLGFLRWLSIPNSWSLVESGLILFNPTTQKRLYHPAFTEERQEIFDGVRRGKIPTLLREFPFLVPYIGKEWNIALERGEGAPPISECERIVKEALGGIPGVTIHASSIAVDISPEGIDKGSGVLWLSEVSGVPPSRMLLIDDSMGGKPAADKVGFLACAADADEKFVREVRVREREQRGYVSLLNLVEGVVDAICHYTGISVPV